ncbi:RHS repeat-associated core domain-containing protein [Streptomyces sp. HUAS ZL42]|uniref:RHS repeat-associated core domain-containing protein n=1 Tax=Streptomyces sp. HUAS ZL42 TaxID=3231715 RepID=UPI00345E6D94
MRPARLFVVAVAFVQTCGTTTFTYNGGSNNLAGDGTTAYNRTPEGDLLSLSTGTTKQLAVTDQHTDLVAALNADATQVTGSTAYDPFGKETATNGTTPAVGYQSGWTDPASGDVNMAARWYQPGTGSFASRDTWQLDPSPSGQANRYSYANEDPVNGTDPTGHVCACGGGSPYSSRIAGNSYRAPRTGRGGYDIAPKSSYRGSRSSSTKTRPRTTMSTGNRTINRAQSRRNIAELRRLERRYTTTSKASSTRGRGASGRGCTYRCSTSTTYRGPRSTRGTGTPRTGTTRPPKPSTPQNPNRGKSPTSAPTRPAPRPRVDVARIQQRTLDRAVVVDQDAMLGIVVDLQNALDPEAAYEADSSRDDGRRTEDDEDQENCTEHLGQTVAGRGMSGIVCFRAPAGATQDQIDELKDHIAALNAIPNYWSPKGRVSPKNELVVGPDGAIDTLERIAEKIKGKHKREVAGTPYQYNGKVAGHLPDTNWSGAQSPYCWHQQDGDVNSKVGRYSQKYRVGYQPTGFYYGGVDGDPSTYTTEHVTGSVMRGQYGICNISRP